MHLGVSYLERGDPELALEMFELQETQYGWAENAYYQSMAYAELGDAIKSKSYMQKAHDRYLSETNMVDVYTRHEDKIYLADIEKALANKE